MDLHIQQPYDYPQINVDVDRSKALFLGLTEQNIASNLLVSLSGSFQTSPSFWIDPKSGTQYNVVSQTPQFRLASLNDLGNTPLSQTVGTTPAAGGTSQILSNVATTRRSVAPAVVSHYNAQTAFDIFGNVQGTDLGFVAAQFNKVIEEAKKNLPKGSQIHLKGQVETMQQSFRGLLLGLVGAIVLVYMLIVVNFQSLLDPLIIITALPAALAGIVWMLFLTHTTVSVPALTGAIMCMGVATANSVLVISFAREQMIGGQGCQGGRPGSGLHAAASGADDGARHDHRHDPDGTGPRRERRAKCAARPRRHWRVDFCDRGDAHFRAHRIHHRARTQAPRKPGGRPGCGERPCPMSAPNRRSSAGA